MLVAPYYRFSHEKDERGISVEVQAQTVERYAAQQGWTLTAPYVDAGKSAYNDNIAKRPQFQRLLEDARRKQFQAVLVYKYDRFARKRKIFFSCLDELEGAGISVRSATESDDWLCVGLSGLLAEQYSRMLSARMKDVRRWEATQGRLIGPLPVGYSRTGPGTIAPDERAGAVLLAAQLYLTGTIGAHLITRALNDAGWRMPDGGHFKTTAVEEMLKNPLYAGIVECNGVQYPGKHEPLFDAATWQALQDMVERRSTRHARSGVRTTPLLSGIIVCGSCAAPMWYHSPREANRYYRCSAAINQVAGPQSDSVICRDAQAHADPVEQTVMGWIAGLAMMPGLRADVERILGAPVARPPAPDARDVETKLRRLARAYADGAYSDEEYDARRGALLGTLDAPPVPAERRVDAILQLLENIPELLAEATNEERRPVVQQLVSEVYARRREVMAIRPTLQGEAFFRAAQAAGEEWLKCMRGWAGRAPAPHPHTLLIQRPPVLLPVSRPV